ncbi:MAG: GTPase HflX [Deltaproteobacteria bacterium]|nr:GTPase HflX [Deltaproteobacteria bacterium]
MSKLYGQTVGLKPSQVKRLERIYQRRLTGGEVIAPDLARIVTEISKETGRQIGLLIDRRGAISHVIVGDGRGIVIPPLSRLRGLETRLKGLRLIHTHLLGEPLSDDDLADLSLLSLDLVAVLQVKPDGLPGAMTIAHLLPQTIEGKDYRIITADHPAALDLDFLPFIQALEEEFARTGQTSELDSAKDRAILVSVSDKSRAKILESLAELAELATSSGIKVLDQVIQVTRKMNSRYVLGRGKLTELMARMLQMGANLLIFDQELNPSQVRSLTDATEVRIIDRTQLILDIFARRAKSREGKIQVEIAQLKYLLPRLVVKNTAMSRLTGGIGARGPGETKLEINRRRANDRLHRLQKQLENVRKERQLRRSRRRRQGLPVISIIGYTNAGKSTLLNALTKSRVFTENKPFATLDPTSRRLRFPRDVEVIITDTVGFIADLPKDLMEAFKATLEEMEDADLLLHVVDAGSPAFEKHTTAVEQILAQINLDQIPILMVLNKEDLADPLTVANRCQQYDAVSISALDVNTFGPLLERMEDFFLNQAEENQP